MKKYTLKLYDKYGFFKAAEYYNEYVAALRSGQNWELLNNGNRAEIKKKEAKK